MAKSKGIAGNSIFASSEEYRDVTFSAVASTTNREASLAFRMQDADNGYIVIFGPPRTPCPWNPNGLILLVKRISGSDTTILTCQKRKLAIIGQSAKITVVARGPLIEVHLNGVKILQANDETFASGYIGFRIDGWEDFPCDATFSHESFH
jgi:hypothetical protein